MHYHCPEKSVPELGSEGNSLSLMMEQGNIFLRRSVLIGIGDITGVIFTSSNAMLREDKIVHVHVWHPCVVICMYAHGGARGQLQLSLPALLSKAGSLQKPRACHLSWPGWQAPERRLSPCSPPAQGLQECTVTTSLYVSVGGSELRSLDLPRNILPTELSPQAPNKISVTLLNAGN